MMIRLHKNCTTCLHLKCEQIDELKIDANKRYPKSPFSNFSYAPAERFSYDGVLYER